MVKSPWVEQNPDPLSAGIKADKFIVKLIRLLPLSDVASVLAGGKVQWACCGSASRVQTEPDFSDQWHTGTGAVGGGAWPCVSAITYRWPSDRFIT